MQIYFVFLQNFSFLDFHKYRQKKHQVLNSHHGLLIRRKQVLFKFALHWHLDQVDRVDVQWIFRISVAISLKLRADVRGCDDLEAEADGGRKEVNQKTSSVETRTVVAPWTSNQIKLDTVAFDARSVNSVHARKIVLHDASLQHLLISTAEVDESKVVCAGETDAGKAGRCWDASSEQEHALVVLLARDVDGICEGPTSLQHRLTNSRHQLTSLNCFRTGAVPRPPIQSHLGVVLPLRLVVDPEAAVGDGLSHILAFFLAVDQSEVDLAQVLDNHVDDPVVVNVGLRCPPRVAIHLDVMNCVAQNLLLLLPLDPGRPGILDRILHHALHPLVVVQQNNSVRLPWSNTNHLSCWAFTGDLPEEESPSLKSIPGEI